MLMIYYASILKVQAKLFKLFFSDKNLKKTKKKEKHKHINNKREKNLNQIRNRILVKIIDQYTMQFFRRK